RVDFANMGTFASVAGKSELDLLKQYLQRDHDYRRGSFTAQQRGAILDTFNRTTSGAWSNFSGFFGPDNTDPIPQNGWFSALGGTPYLWADGSGPGDSYFVFERGLGSTTDMATPANHSNAVFNMLFGSYVGDWD